MKTSIAASLCIVGALALAACSHAGAAPASGQHAPMQPGQNGQRMGMNPQDLQKYADEANAASDKTTLTKDQFTAEMTALRQKQMAQYQQTGSGRQFSGNRQRFGSGSMMRGQNGQPGINGARQNPLDTAATYLKYTDPSGQEVLLALDADGKVLMKFPMMFGRRSGMMQSSSASAQ